MNLRALFFCLLLLPFVNQLTAQDYSKLDKIILKDKKDCAENEGLVLECSNYIIGSSIQTIDTDENRVKAIQFVMRWMEATPEYSFLIDESMMEVTSSNPSLLGIILVSMSKYVLENKDGSDDPDDIKYNAFLTFIDYIENPDNDVSLTPDLKELIKARDENTLKQYLKIERRGIITMI
jgi:hypothetical protein